MRVDIETNKESDYLAQEKGEKLQKLSDTMSDDVLDLFYQIASKPQTPDEVEKFNKKVMSNKLIIQITF